MSEDHLFDPSAPPDPEVRRLEHLLAIYRWPGGAPPPLPAATPRPRIPLVVPGLAAAMLLAAGLALAPRLRPAPPLGPGWTVEAVAGAPSMPAGELRRGDLILTDDRSRAEVRIPGVGRVAVEPGTRLRLLGEGGGRRGLALDHGTIVAVSTAPPRLFYVETPAATAVDLGCEFSLSVEPDSGGLLTVRTGWVAFEKDGREWLVPAGARCRTDRRTGPGTPRFTDAPAALAEALDRMDRGSGGPGDLAALLAAARPRDTLSLWHLAAGESPGDRGALYDRAAELSPWPQAVSRERVVAGAPGDLLAWREGLRPLW